MNWYALDDDLTPRLLSTDVSATEYFEWHRGMPDSADWYIAKTGVGFQIALDNLFDGIRVSTIYFGMDHNWAGGSPILWETMVFDDSGLRPDMDMYQNRYTSHAEAIEGHKRICRLVASEGLESLTNRATE